MNKKLINVVGGGLAGCEAAHQISKNGIRTNLFEMRPKIKTDAHQTGLLAELVCSNSLRSDDKNYNAVGLLHEELRLSDSIIMQAADKNKVPAGSALAVDRLEFSSSITNSINNNPYIKIINEEVKDLDSFGDELTIIATGPLTSSKLSEHLNSIIKEKPLDFFDAISPIVYSESLDMNIVWKQSRYDKGDGDDYINCPLTEDEYYDLVNSIKSSSKIDLKNFEKTPFFEGCMPIEEMVKRGNETLRFGPMKPVGLTNPHKKIKPYAVLQLRQDNASGTLFNLVGFQTKMKHKDQIEVFRKIPGLKNAKFARLGGLHRNTFINSPNLLNNFLRLKKRKNIFFAGQITGVEGYVESSAIGNLAGRIASKCFLNQDFFLPPDDTAHGALLSYITQNANPKTFQPMNINFGIINSDEIFGIRGKEKKKLITKRALKSFEVWLKRTN